MGKSFIEQADALVAEESKQMKIRVLAGIIGQIKLNEAEIERLKKDLAEKDKLPLEAFIRRHDDFNMYSTMK